MGNFFEECRIPEKFDVLKIEVQSIELDRFLIRFHFSISKAYENFLENRENYIESFEGGLLELEDDVSLRELINCIHFLMLNHTQIEEEERRKHLSTLEEKFGRQSTSETNEIDLLISNVSYSREKENWVYISRLAKLTADRVVQNSYEMEGKDKDYWNER